MLSKFNTTAVMLRTNMLKSSVVGLPARDFGAKKKKKTDSAEASGSETVDEAVAEPVAEVVAEPVKAAPVKAAAVDASKPWLKVQDVLNLDKSLFVPYTLGDVNVIQSTPDNKAPSYEDTIEGRYANVLFTTASQSNALFDVYEDMMYLSELYVHSTMFRQFTENGGVGIKEITELNKVLNEVTEFNPVTTHFLTVLA